jgi:6-pyruvoyltetrahydropterin/6-carboxytetrahydropterin synthase
MKVLQNLIEQEVLSRFDHMNLNLDVPDFKDLNPTAENIAVVIWKRLRNKLEPTLKLKIKLYETERNIVEYEGK